MTPDELARAAAKGDIDAFETLLGLYQNKVYGLALRMCGSEEDAWDVAQEAFLAAWRALPGFRGESGFSTWLYRLTANAAIDCLRREKKRRGELSIEGGELPLSLPDAGPSPQEATEGGELRAAVNAALARLTDQHRTVLILRELQELSYEEIAGALGLGPEKSGHVRYTDSRPWAARLVELGGVTEEWKRDTAGGRSGPTRKVARWTIPTRK